MPNPRLDWAKTRSATGGLWGMCSTTVGLIKIRETLLRPQRQTALKTIDRTVSGALSLTSAGTRLMIPLAHQITTHKATFEETIKTRERAHLIDFWAGRQGPSEIRKTAWGHVI